jgi:hypothetical protein
LPSPIRVLPRRPTARKRVKKKGILYTRVRLV